MNIMLDLFCILGYILVARARPVGAGEPGKGYVLIGKAIGFVQFDDMKTDTVRGSIPLRKHFGVSRECQRRGSRWLAFFIACKKVTDPGLGKSALLTSCGSLADNFKSFLGGWS